MDGFWLLFWALAIGQAGGPTTGDWDWLNENRLTALEKLMPMDGKHAAYRSYRDLYQDVHERYFAISDLPGPAGFGAVVVRPMGDSIQQQLLDLHLLHPEAGLEELLPRVAVLRREIDYRSCPAVMDRLDALGKLSFKTPAQNMIVLHPEVHQIELEFGGGRMRARIYEDDHPLVVWALETLEEFERCAAVER